MLLANNSELEALMRVAKRLGRHACDIEDINATVQFISGLFYGGMLAGMRELDGEDTKDE